MISVTPAKASVGNSRTAIGIGRARGPIEEADERFGAADVACEEHGVARAVCSLPWSFDFTIDIGIVLNHLQGGSPPPPFIAGDSSPMLLAPVATRNHVAAPRGYQAAALRLGCGGSLISSSPGLHGSGPSRDNSSCSRAS
jgi:hypothetical protein